MKPAPLPDDETERLAALRQTGVLDTLPEPCFDRLTALAAHLCDAPIALISLVDEDRQWFKSRVGITAEQTSRDVAFCSHAILGEDLMVVPDALRDDRFARNPLVVADPKIRFYAGAPLRTHEGHALGTLCVIDNVPHDLPPDQARALRILARHTANQLELRRVQQGLREVLLGLEASHRALADDKEQLDAHLELRTEELVRVQQHLEEALAERESCEAELRQLESRYQEAQRAAVQGELICSIAREVGHALDSISEHAETLQYGLDAKDAVRRPVDAIADAAHRAGQLLRQIGPLASEAGPRPLAAEHDGGA